MTSQRARRGLLRRVEQITEATIGKQESTVRQAMARADDWLLAVFAAGAEEVVRRVDAYAAFFEAAGGAHMVRLIGPPADDAAIARVEGELGFAVPVAYRTLLQHAGKIAFMDRQHVDGREICPPTFGVDQLSDAYQRFAPRLALLSQGYGDLYGQLRQAYASYAPDWRDWVDGGVFRPEEMQAPRWLPICPYFDEAAHFLALHLGDRQDAPIFIGGGADEPYFFVRVGSGLQQWVSAMVDRAIVEVATTLSAILS